MIHYMQLQSLKLQCQTVQKEMQLQVNTLFDLWVKVTQTVAKFSLHHVTYVLAKFQVATPTGLFDLWVKVTQTVAKFSLHHVTYVLAKFQFATPTDLTELDL